MEPTSFPKTDHDLLITLHEQVRGIRDDIKEVKDGIKTSIDDHENRIRGLERKQWALSGAAALLGASSAFLVRLFFTK